VRTDATEGYGGCRQALLFSNARFELKAYSAISEEIAGRLTDVDINRSGSEHHGFKQCKLFYIGTFY
jgi:hypothetical protein